MTNKEAKEKIFYQWQDFLEHNIDYAGISEAYKMAISALEQEPKTGHWIDTDEGFSPCECSECKSVEFKRSKYCPNCGADMRGAE